MIKSVGRVMRTLRALDLRENTVLIFYFDNGGLGGYRSIGLENDGITDNAPLKGSFYEGASGGPSSCGDRARCRPTATR